MQRATSPVLVIVLQLDMVRSFWADEGTARAPRAMNVQKTVPLLFVVTRGAIIL
jgi:hypothetical protein